MAGCTDLAYRKVARDFGCQIAFTEMVKDRPVVERNSRTLEMLRTAEWDHPLGMQVVGRDPALMAEAARVLEGLGADVIDINLGCPVTKVVAQGCGAAMIQEPEQVARVLDAMIPAVKVPVTIKMRVGGDDLRYLDVARIASDRGVGSITVHGRTQAQLYRGLSNHDAIRAVKEAVDVPVIGNGDIRSGADAKRMFEATGCDGVMVARGALGNPWLYKEIETYLATGEVPPPPTIGERADVLRRHFALLREIYGDAKACTLVRRVITWFVKGAAGSASLRDRAQHVGSAEEVEALIADFSANVGASPQR